MSQVGPDAQSALVECISAVLQQLRTRSSDPVSHVAAIPVTRVTSPSPRPRSPAQLLRRRYRARARRPHARGRPTPPRAQPRPPRLPTPWPTPSSRPPLVDISRPTGNSSCHPGEFLSRKALSCGSKAVSEAHSRLHLEDTLHLPSKRTTEPEISPGSNSPFVLLHTPAPLTGGRSTAAPGVASRSHSFPWSASSSSSRMFTVADRLMPSVRNNKGSSCSGGCSLSLCTQAAQAAGAWQALLGTVSS
ncbi:uncharacterized protein PHACADRAFT_195771 [Phanerochaete carnosa HHB-10118-sp]|uniref:Uncharacterized protein n=1 Tax=Phanerochaete carnosa (strain HHB-10118-sp) TaxID=650164 RepID=K5WZ01_PHACS|nr:uncharacterized protein PHACADRAFT_195771 [Phanerochaete carnosa HHB-10118-sp]EKM55727.1 hypothetical protein PHACADRAFT_195771 [Phanerochaete carnosa HHB-10118-sp]